MATTNVIKDAKPAAPVLSADVEVECLIRCEPPAVVQGIGAWPFGEKRRVSRAVAMNLGDGFRIIG